MSLIQYKGCITGQAIGDALGFPVEGQGPKICERYISEIEQGKLPQNRSRFRFGQYTDDTQLARELMIGIVKLKSFDPEYYAKQISHLFQTGAIVGQGLATRNAAERLISGIPWYEAGEPLPSAGNGTAMRAAPIGLYYRNQINEIIKQASLQSSITHKDERCTTGSILIAAATSYLIDNEPEGLLDHLLSVIKDESLIFRASLRELKEWIHLDYQKAVQRISNSGEPDFKDGWVHISPYVIPSVLWSIYAFMTSPDNFQKAINTAIMVGGDVDTTAAMTGALSGVYLGKEKLPQKYLSVIHDKGHWKVENLSKLAEELYEISHI